MIYLKVLKKAAQGIIFGAFAPLNLARPAFAQASPSACFEFPRGGIPFTNLGELLSRALLLLFFLAAVLAFAFIVIGGIQWITAGGDKLAAQTARDRITAAVVGLLIVVATFAITLIVTTIFNINIFGGKFGFPGTTIFTEPCP